MTLYLTQFLTRIPTMDEALKISLDFEMALHPQITSISGIRYLVEELEILLNPKTINETSIEYSSQSKKILEKLERLTYRKMTLYS